MKLKTLREEVLHANLELVCRGLVLFTLVTPVAFLAGRAS